MEAWSSASRTATTVAASKIAPMITIRSILGPCEGSEFARRALEHATALGRFDGAGLCPVLVARAGR